MPAPRLVLILAALLAAGPALAQFPQKPVTITVGFAAGGTTDVAARAVGEVVAKRLGQPVVIENKPGAGGAVAATTTARMAPDGYNLYATTSTTISFDPHATPVTYGVDDFTYIAAIGEFPEAYVALPSKGWKTLAEAIAAGKASGGMNYASSTSIDRVLTAVIAKKSGVPLRAVPTRSGAEVVTQVMGGHVDLGYSSGAYIPQAKDGKLTVLAVLGDKRMKDMAEAPTLMELGYDLASVNLVLFAAPKGLPAEVRKTLVDAFAAAAKDPAIVDLMQKRNLGDVVLLGDDLTKTMQEHSERYKRMIEASK